MKANEIYRTSVLHKECEEKLAAKCRWEHMSRMAVLNEWDNVVCMQCAAHVRSPLKKDTLPLAALGGGRDG